MFYLPIKTTHLLRLHSCMRLHSRVRLHSCVLISTQFDHEIVKKGIGIMCSISLKMCILDIPRLVGCIEFCFSFHFLNILISDVGLLPLANGCLPSKGGYLIIVILVEWFPFYTVFTKTSILWYIIQHLPEFF